MADELNEVRSTLLRVAQRLSTISSSSSSSESTSTASQVTAPALPVNVQGVARIPTSVSLEQRRLFGYGIPKKKTSAGKGKRTASCTLKFFCLASKDAQKPPSSVREKTFLSNAGLGDGSISFDMDGSSVYDKIFNKYPLLQSAGGFDILLFQRGGGEDAGFHAITPPHTASRLKEVCGQCKIYLRPVQQDIKLESQGESSSKEVTENMEKSVPLLPCFLSKTPVLMSEMRKHYEENHGASAPKRQKRIDDNAFESSPSTSGSQSNDSSYQESIVHVRSPHVVALKEICPGATDDEIQEALSASFGNVDEAAQQLLGVPTISLVEDNVNDADLMKSFFDYETGTISSPEDALKKFQKDVIDEDGISQRFIVSRMDGVSEMKRDIMGLYKNPKTRLKVPPKVRFEGEEGVGSGPVREFLLNAMKILDEGIPCHTGKQLLFFTGEKDHRLPVHDQSLRLTGSFKAVGRIIGHSILHGGPGLHGLSPAVKHYLTTGKEAGNEVQPPPLALEDIPDFDLRQMIAKLDSLPKDTKPSADMRSELETYLFEAGLDPDLLHNNHEVVVEGLMTFQVLEKRILELDDISKGMDEVSLHQFLKRCPSLAQIVFPLDSERDICVEEMKKCLVFEEADDHKVTCDYFLSYIDEIGSKKEDGTQILDLVNFWTGGSSLGSDGHLLVKFDGGANELPLSETCFRTIVLPTKHTTYEEFKKCMDTALKYGSKGFSFS